jgi:large subunit ribosomal protein L24
MKIRLDDNVLIISGKDRGKKGRVQRVMNKRSKVVVEKVNIRTKHIKKKGGEAGQKIHFEAPIDSSKVMILCPNCEKPTRVATTILKTGKSQRVCKKCGQSLDKAVEKKNTKKR